MGGEAFSDDDHLWTIGEERGDGKKDREAANKTKLKGLVRDLKVTNRRLIIRAKITGVWLVVCSTTFSSTVLSATEFWDFLCAHYNIYPLNFQSHCGGCGTSFGVVHTLTCSTGGLVIARHNKIRDKLIYLSQIAFTSASVRAKPLTHQGRTRFEQEICQGSDKDKETRGYVMF